MAYSIVTKDGITINNIPDNVPKDSQDLKDRVTKLRADRLGGDSPAPSSQPLDVPTPQSFAADEARVAANNSVEDGKPLSLKIEEGVIGAGETALALGTGATTGTAGRVVGTLFGFAKELYDKAALGEEWNDDDIQKMAAFGQEAGTYAPITEKGQEYTQAIADSEVVRQLDATGPIGMPQAGSLGRQAASLQKLPEVSPVNPGAAAKTAAIASSEAQGIRTMTSDVIAPDTFTAKTGQAITERMPLAGTGGIRAKQQTERVNAIKNLFNEYGGGQLTNASTAVMDSLSEQYSNKIGKYSDQKMEVINRLDGAPLNETMVNKSIDAAISQLEKSNVRAVDAEGNQSASAIDGVIGKLRGYKETFEGKSISSLELLRKQLGEELSDPEKAGAKKASEKAFRPVYKALNDTIGNYIKDNGERRDFAKWRVANVRLAENIGEVKKTALKNILEKGDIKPEMVETLLMSKKRSENELLRKNLNRDGIKNAQIALIQKVADKVMVDDYVSPDKFLTEAVRNKSAFDTFFKGADKAQLQGLIESLKLTRRASVAAVNAQTGDKMAMATVGTMLGASLGFWPTVAVSAGIGLAGRAYESAPVKRALIKLSGAKSVKAKNVAYAAYLRALKNTELGIITLQNQNTEQEE